MSRRLLGSIVVAVCLATGSLAHAQTADEFSTPAHVSAVQGTAVLERDGQVVAAVENLPLLEGDRLRTEDGRLEVLLPDGSVLALDHHSTLDLRSGGLMRLLGGRMAFVVSGQLEGEARSDYQVDSPAGMVRLLTGGEYRLSSVATAGSASLEVAVVSGKALIDASGAQVSVMAGQRTVATEGRGIAAVRGFDSAATDDFYGWADELQDERAGSTSNAYLPPDLQVYGGTFDRDGTWDSSPDSEWVWYPNVSSDWRPYYDGAWQSYGWGWTWVGAGRWMWPTHHYGRWGHAARGWYWIPAAQWGPAWVSWGHAAGYVSWCPLGYNDGPVSGLSFGLAAGPHSSPWQGWTVVPYRAFERGSRVPAYALRGEQLKAVERTSFAVRRAGPAVPGMAVARGRNDLPVSPYDRAQAAAADQPRQSGPGATARSRSFDTRTFSAPGQAPLPYPERFRPNTVPQYRDSGGAAAPRSGPVPGIAPEVPESLTPSGSPRFPVPRTDSPAHAAPVPHYYLGPSSNPEPPPSSPTPVSSAALPSAGYAAPHDRPSAAAPTTDPRAFGLPSGQVPHSYVPPGPAAVPRSDSEPKSSSAPPSAAPRAHSAPDQGGGQRSGPVSSGLAGGRGSGGTSQAPASGARPSGGLPARGGRGGH